MAIVVYLFSTNARFGCLRKSKLPNVVILGFWTCGGDFSSVLYINCIKIHYRLSSMYKDFTLFTSNIMFRCFNMQKKNEESSIAFLFTILSKIHLTHSIFECPKLNNILIIFGTDYFV